MNKQQAYNFVHKVLDIIVIEADVEKLKDIYNQDAKLHINDLTFGYSDIENRIDFIKNTYTHRQHKLYGVEVINDVIIFQDQQSLKNINTNELEQKILTGSYILKNGKISEAWLITNEKIDYLQKA